MLRLRDDDTEWGLTRLEYARRAQLRIRRQEKARAEANRLRNDRGRFIAKAPSIEMPKPGEIFMTEQGPAYQVMQLGTSVSLPWISILGTNTMNGGRE
jgi:hypothetical protein